MKTFNNFIIEKILINKDTNVDNHEYYNKIVDIINKCCIDDADLSNDNYVIHREDKGNGLKVKIEFSSKNIFPTSKKFRRYSLYRFIFYQLIKTFNDALTDGWSDITSNCIFFTFDKNKFNNI